MPTALAPPKVPLMHAAPEVAPPGSKFANVQSIVAEDASRGQPIAFNLGHTPATFWDNAKPVSRSKADRSAVVRAFKAHLADYKLPDDVIEGYAITLHHSEFVLVKTQASRADQVGTIMRECGAIRTDRHG